MYKENGRQKNVEKAEYKEVFGKVLTCPKCGSSYHVESLQFGEQVTCLSCKAFLEEETI